MKSSWSQRVSASVRGSASRPASKCLDTSQEHVLTWCPQAKIVEMGKRLAEKKEGGKEGSSNDANIDGAACSLQIRIRAPCHYQAYRLDLIIRHDAPGR